MQIHGVVRFAIIVAVGACGGTDVRAPTVAPAIASACIPAGADVVPTVVALRGAQFRFCLAERAGKTYCFAADLDAKTIVTAPAPTVASGDPGTRRMLWEGNRSGAPDGPSIGPSARGTGLTACTSDKVTCHDLPIDATSKPIAVSDDAALVAIEIRNSPDRRKSSGRVETWDARTGKKLASFQIRYGPTTPGYETADRYLEFLGHTVIAYTMSACALPCSSATMYSVRGTYLGMLALDPTAASAEHAHGDVYVLRSPVPDASFAIQDVATGKRVPLDGDSNWDAVVTPDRIVGVAGPVWNSDPPRSPRIDVWGADLTLVSTIAVPSCAAGPAGHPGRPSRSP